MTHRNSHRLWSVWAVGAILLSTTAAHAADPTTADCLGASEASVKLRSDHKLREARAQLLTCASASCPADIAAECTRRVDQVNSQIPTIVFEAKDGAGNDLTAVKVTMDGQTIADRLAGTAISLDPGEHKFVFEVEGQTPVAKTIVLHEGEKDRRERIVIGPVPAGGTAVSTNAGTTGEGQGSATTPAPEEDHTAKRIIGFTVGGLGLASGVVAILEFLTSSSRNSDSKSAALSTDPNVQATVGTLHNQATQAQTYGIVFTAVGVAAVGTGLYLILTSGSSSPEPAKSATASRFWVTPTVGPQGGALQVGGAW